MIQEAGTDPGSPDNVNATYQSGKVAEGIEEEGLRLPCLCSVDTQSTLGATL